MKRAVIRLPKEVVERLDKLAEALSLAHPERRFSRAAAVRVVLAKGLALIEAAGGKVDGALDALVTPGPRSGGAPRP